MDTHPFTLEEQQRIASFKGIDVHRLKATLQQEADRQKMGKLSPTNPLYITAACERGDILSIPRDVLAEIPNLGVAAIRTLITKEAPKPITWQDLPEIFREAIQQVDSRSGEALNHMLSRGVLQKMPKDLAEQWVQLQLKTLAPEKVIQHVLYVNLTHAEDPNETSLLWGLTTQQQIVHYNRIRDSLESWLKELGYLTVANHREEPVYLIHAVHKTLKVLAVQKVQQGRAISAQKHDRP